MGCGPLGGIGRLKDIGSPRPVQSFDDDQMSERSEKRQKAEANLQIVEATMPRTSSLAEELVVKEQGSLSKKLSVLTSYSSSSRLSSRSQSVRRGGSVLSGASKLSVSSQLNFASPDQTIIFFDWDDTLCPSSWLRQHMKFDGLGQQKAQISAETKQEMQMLSDQVIPLIELAQHLGRVVVVTNARRPWVDTSCHHFLSACKSTMKHIPVMYALEIMKELDLEHISSQGGCVLTETKAHAMRAAVSTFYSRYRNQSWKNIISIGDALFEHDAIRQVSQERPFSEVETKRLCRTKTVKLLEGPSITGMIVQLSIINSWLQRIVQYDGDVDIDLAADEKTVNEWVTQFADGYQESLQKGNKKVSQEGQKPASPPAMPAIPRKTPATDNILLL